MVLHWENHNLHGGRRSRRSLGGACAVDGGSDPEGMVYKSQKDLEYLGSFNCAECPTIVVVSGEVNQNVFVYLHYIIYSTQRKRTPGQ